MDINMFQELIARMVTETSEPISKNGPCLAAAATEITVTWQSVPITL